MLPAMPSFILCGFKNDLKQEASKTNKATADSNILSITGRQHNAKSHIHNNSFVNIMIAINDSTQRGFRCTCMNTKKSHPEIQNCNTKLQFEMYMKYNK